MQRLVGRRVGMVWALGLILLGQYQAPARAQDRGPGPDRPVLARHNYATWEKEIAAFEAKDREAMPPKGGIVFTGSSTVRLWKSLETDFAGLPVINRGFGGSTIADATHFADRIIFPYAPKQVVLRAGTNDLHEGRLPREVADDFADFVRTVHARLPQTEILFIGGNPTPSRWSENDKILDLNRRIKEMALEMPRVALIDVYPISTKVGNVNPLFPEIPGETPIYATVPRPELFVADRLHFNAQGYRILAEQVRPYLPPPPTLPTPLAPTASPAPPAARP